MIPFDIWSEISQHVPPDPFTYIRLSHISRSAYLSFTRDQLWQQVTPSQYQKKGGLHQQFLSRVNQMPYDERTKLRALWDRSLPVLTENHKLRVRYFLRDLAAYYPHNGDLVLAMCAIDGSTLEFVPSWHSDFQIIDITLQTYGYALCFIPLELRDNFRLVMRAVHNTSVALCHASPRLRNNKEIVRQAVRAHGFAFCYASDELRSNREFCLEVLRHTGRALEFVNLRADRKLVLAAVRNYGPAIQFAATQFLSDKEVVLRAVRNHGTVLALVGDELRNDIDVVYTAIRSEPWALEHASPQLRDNKALVIEAVGRRGWCLRHASERLCDDPQVVRLAVKVFPGALEYASDKLKDDLSILLVGLSNDLSIISTASPRLQVLVYGIIALGAYVMIPFVCLIRERLDA